MLAYKIGIKLLLILKRLKKLREHDNILDQRFTKIRYKNSTLIIIHIIIWTKFNLGQDSNILFELQVGNDCLCLWFSYNMHEYASLSILESTSHNTVETFPWRNLCPHIPHYLYMRLIVHDWMKGNFLLGRAV